jgi:hypothetical protein
VPTRSPPPSRGPDLPGWTHLPPGDDSWAPRLVHTDGAAVMVTCVGARVVLRAVRPHRLSHYQWTPREITVAADAPRSRLVSHFTRRLAADLLPQHAGVMQILRRQDDASAAREATCARLRALVPPAWLDQPWPADTHDVRLRLPGESSTSGRLRVLGPDHVDVTLDGLDGATTERVLRALVTSHPCEFDEPVAGFPAIHVPDVSTAMVPRQEMDTITAAPTLVAPFAHGAWVHTSGALNSDAAGRDAWASWPHLRALLVHAASAGAGWVLLDADGSVITPEGTLPVHDW